MDENNMNGNIEPSDGGQQPAESGPSNKKVGIGLLVTAILLCLFSDVIPGPVDDIISLILGIISGRNLFGN